MTAHSNHAVRAFEIEAVDYVFKPVRPERLAAAVARTDRLRRVGRVSLPTPPATASACARRSAPCSPLSRMSPRSKRKKISRVSTLPVRPPPHLPIDRRLRAHPSPPPLPAPEPLAHDQLRAASPARKTCPETKRVSGLKASPPFPARRAGRARLNEHLGTSN